GLQILIGILGAHRACPDDNPGGHREPPTFESHFFEVNARPASLACTALGMPSPNWLTVRTSLPLEHDISTYFSLCMGLPNSSFIWATIFLVFTSTTSADER